MMQSTGLRKVQLSRRSVAPSACRRWALGAGLGPSGSQRNGAATESMTTRRTIPRDSSTGTFLCTHSSSVSWRPSGGRHCPRHPHLPLRLAPRDPLRPSRLTPESLAGLARPPCRPSPRPGPVLRGPHACLNTWTWPRRQSQPVPAVITGTAPSSGGSGAALSPAQQRARGQVCPPGSAWSMENPGPCPGCTPGSGRRAGARGRVQVPGPQPCTPSGRGRAPRGRAHRAGRCGSLSGMKLSSVLRPPGCHRPSLFLWKMPAAAVAWRALTSV